MVRPGIGLPLLPPSPCLLFTLNLSFFPDISFSSPLSIVFFVLGLHWDGILVAGGSVLACLLPDQQVDHSHADVDLYLLTRSEAEASRIVSHIYSVISANVVKYAEEERYSKVECVKTRRTLSFRTAWMSFQVITTLFHSALEVLVGFDIDCGCVGTVNGVEAVMTNRAEISLKSRLNMWLMQYRPTLAIEGRYQNRLAKYSRRGFGVLVPHKVDWNKMPILEPKHMDRLQGIAKLALIDRIATVRREGGNGGNTKAKSVAGEGVAAEKTENTAETSSTSSSTSTTTVSTTNAIGGGGDGVYHTYASGIEECIHGGDAWCKHCHKKLPHAEADVNDRLSFSAPIKWQREGLSYQDFEAGRQVRILAGMIEVDPNFENSVYTPSSPTHTPGTTTDTVIYGSDSNNMVQPEDSTTLDNKNRGSSSSSSSTGAPLSDAPGISVPNCYCGMMCSVKAAKKEGPNYRRRFFCCRFSQSPQTSCRFFQWEGNALPYDQARAQRLKETVNVNHIPEVISELQYDKAKQLLAISTCYKSGRITSEHRTLLKEVVLKRQSPVQEDTTNSKQQTEVLEGIFAAFAQHFDIDVLGEQLTQFCNSSSNV